MTEDRLEELARAYREALAEESAAKRAVTKARGRHTEALKKVADKRSPLAEAIIEESRAGRPPKEIIEITGYTRQRIRQLCRAAGVPPFEG